MINFLPIFDILTPNTLSKFVWHLWILGTIFHFSFFYLHLLKLYKYMLIHWRDIVSIRKIVFLSYARKCIQADSCDTWCLSSCYLYLQVDSVEGPMPQTRFVLKKALEFGHSVVVVVNKIDRPSARPEFVVNSTFELFIELNATDEQVCW